MTRTRAYLDWNATAPLKPAAKAAMIAALEVIGNPSSVHTEGRAARELIEQARDAVAALVGARPAEVVFTSGATEANATVFVGAWDTIYVSSGEHDSVLAAAKACVGARRVDLPMDHSGRVGIEALADDVLRGAAPVGKALATLHLANNETGVIQLVADMAAFARSHGLHTHTDAVQAPGRLPVDVVALGVDYLTISAHKLGGPKGIGALIVREGAPLPRLIAGGGQERRRRAGTENLAAIVGFGAAAREAMRDLEAIAQVRVRRDRLEAALCARVAGLTVIGAEATRLANTSCIAPIGKTAETLVIKYDLAGVAVSAGAACSSGKVATSHVLAAMGIAPDLARAAIRVSIGPTTTDADIAAFLAATDTILRTSALAA